jgi:hypothetical protein
MDLSLDGVYRAVVRGLQVGLGAVLIFWVLNIIVGLNLLSTCTAFVLGTFLGTVFTFYQDTLEVLLRNQE